ncbi:MAG TPA: hydrogenase nickel incorporation protein HypB [Propionibacteriaceae bacterium]
MCATCGCGADEVRVSVPGRNLNFSDDQLPAHDHDHDHDGQHRHDHDRTHTVRLEQAILAKNDHLAAHNREWLGSRGLAAINLMSSPGSGKTTLLERTIRDSGLTLSVIEGDQETTADAERIRAAGARSVQVNTGAGCHLDAAMIHRALDQLAPQSGLVVIENVGNLVCPALFDLGEACRVVIISVTEGDDKPRKYPHMFSAPDLIVINKTDLLPYVDFDMDRLTMEARALRPEVAVLPLSARTGANIDAWYAWLAAVPAAAARK